MWATNPQIGTPNPARYTMIGRPKIGLEPKNGVFLHFLKLFGFSEAEGSQLECCKVVRAGHWLVIGQRIEPQLPPIPQEQQDMIEKIRLFL